MRLDKYLYFARFAKSRSKAQALVATGRPRIDQRPVTTGHAVVSPGNVVTIMIGERVRVVKIVALPLRRGSPEEARRCFEELSPAQTIDAGAL